MLELRYYGIGNDFTCLHCKDPARLEIVELHRSAYKLRCARCRASVWGGTRGTILWNVKGFSGRNEIYNEDIELGLDAIRSRLQSLVRQHVMGADSNRPELWEVRRNPDAPRLSFVCGVDPYYVAIAILRGPVSG